MGLVDDDLPGLLEDIGTVAHGVPVSFAGPDGPIEGHGISQQGDSESFSFEGMTFTGKVRRVTLQTSAWPGLAAGSTLTVDGVQQRVVQVREIYGGTLIEAYCATV